MMRTLNKQRVSNRSHGFGMLELLVAMALGLILMAGILELFVSNKLAYKTSEAMGRLQENSRYALYQMQKEIRMAGYSDCAPNITSHLNPAGDNYDDTLFNLDEPVGGWEYSANSGTGPGDSYTISTLDPDGVAVSSWDDGDGSDLPASLEDLVVPGTDVLSLKSIGSVENISVNSNNNINSAAINTNGANGIEQYTILLITQDCYNADLFQKRNNNSATSVSSGNGASTNPGPGNVGATSLFPGSKKWVTEYGPGARFLTFDSTVYYIGLESGIPSLFKVSFTTGSMSTPELIVEGVENMQILFGEDTDGTEDGIANIYQTVDAVTDPTRISSVRISLLMRTMDEVSADADSKTDYLMTGHSAATSTSIDPENDRYLRYVFTSTVKLRNRGDL